MSQYSSIPAVEHVLDTVQMQQGGYQMLKNQPILMFVTILAWAWMIYSIAVRLPVWQHAIGAYLGKAMGTE